MILPVGHMTTGESPCSSKDVVTTSALAMESVVRPSVRSIVDSSAYWSVAMPTLKAHWVAFTSRHQMPFGSILKPEKFSALPPVWPGYFRLDAHSIPNLDNFDAILRPVDIHGHTVSKWSLRGPVLEIASERYLPDASQYACLRAFEEWHSLAVARETDHLRFIHALADAAGQGCRVDVSQAGKISPVTSAECCVDAEEQPDGTLLLTPIPLFSGLETILKIQCGQNADPSEVYSFFRNAIMDRLGQLEGPGNEAVLRIGPVIIILDEEQTAQARGIARASRVPRHQKDAFRRDPEKWLAEHVFVHGQVEFLASGHWNRRMEWRLSGGGW